MISLPYDAAPPRRVRGRYHLRMTDKPLTYATYLKVPELLELQTSLSSPAHHDEALFIIIHQVYELWFKLVLHEVESAGEEIGQDHVYEGTRLLRRVVEIQRLLIHQVRILETMRPQDFLGFRYHLNPASGFQSIQFREIEFLLGLKNPAVLEHLVCDATERQRLEARLTAPSVSDVFDALLARRGLRPPVAPSQAVASGPSREEDWRVDALVRIYEDPETHADLLALCEVLIEIDECLSLWRAHHVQMVERMIGSLRGTGGSAGVAYLQSTLPKRAFPDLWRVRTRLGQEPERQS
jgi:tryptophan 2,3-dioxygenase